MSSPAANVRHKLSVSDYYRMGDAGILHEDDRIELIEGELIDMAPIGSFHATAVNRIMRQIHNAVSEPYVISGQNPLRLSDLTEPQPDGMILKPRDNDYADAHPGPEDVIVLIEVSDSSLEYDKKVKVPLYARHGVQEMWLFDLNGQRLERYTQPNETGYGHCETLDKTGKISPTALPDVVIELSRILV
jgi:Uma2 family endonuclease